jgi:hypothetical protein
MTPEIHDIAYALPVLVEIYWIARLLFVSIHPVLLPPPSPPSPPPSDPSFPSTTRIDRVSYLPIVPRSTIDRCQDATWCASMRHAMKLTIRCQSQQGGPNNVSVVPTSLFTVRRIHHVDNATFLARTNALLRVGIDPRSSARWT